MKQEPKKEKKKDFTIVDFTKVKPGEIFARGTIIDSADGINMMNTGKELRWIAKRGDGFDWAIYCHWANFSETYIAQSGEKVRSKENVLKCIPCTDEVYQLYRY